MNAKNFEIGLLIFHVKHYLLKVSTEMKKTMQQQRRSIILETDLGGDYDDLIALNLCLAHPKLELLGLLLTPGYPDQIKLAQNILRYFGRDKIPIGTLNSNFQKSKSCVGVRHFDALKKVGHEIVPLERKTVEEGYDLLERLRRAHPDLTYVSISPMKNLGKWAKKYTSELQQSYSMGGYFGDPDLGQEISKHEFNFSGDSSGSHFLMTTDRIQRKVIVSKNVTHHVFYTRETHRKMGNLKSNSKALALTHALMDFWIEKRLLNRKYALKRKKEKEQEKQKKQKGQKEQKEQKEHTQGDHRIIPKNDAENPGRNKESTRRNKENISEDEVRTGGQPIRKKMHDPLTVSVAIDESIVNLVEVQPYRRNKKYGADKDRGTNCFMSYGNGDHVAHKKFEHILLYHSNRPSYHP